MDGGEGKYAGGSQHEVHMHTHICHTNLSCLFLSFCILKALLESFALNFILIPFRIAVSLWRSPSSTFVELIWNCNCKSMLVLTCFMYVRCSAHKSRPKTQKKFRRTTDGRQLFTLQFSFYLKNDCNKYIRMTASLISISAIKSIPRHVAYMLISPWIVFVWFFNQSTVKLIAMFVGINLVLPFDTRYEASGMSKIYVYTRLNTFESRMPHYGSRH